MQSCTWTSDSTLVLGDVANARRDVDPQLGRYRLGALLGSGGMGMVFEAYDPAIDRTVAIKLDRSPRRRMGTGSLQQEALALARIDHPNVIRVLDAGTVSGQPFVAMELVRGTTLASWIADAPRAEREVVAAYIAAGRGLAAVHAAGLVHRDFKPQNVLVDDAGHVRLVDFGLALPTGAPAPTDIIVGTPAFMAPEQLTAGPVDPRADQYSFCKALWAALVDAHPLTPHLAAVLARGMACEAADRFASMDDLLACLSRYDEACPRFSRSTVRHAMARTCASSWPAPARSAPTASVPTLQLRGTARRARARTRCATC
ncbi:MAG TPA: serine/threonine-protein kinase [Kofleriaceae bacterium]|nr:serine/threonine-protein kinase [Kofleriaceae bacterium]